MVRMKERSAPHRNFSSKLISATTGVALVGMAPPVVVALEDHTRFLCFGTRCANTPVRADFGCGDPVAPEIDAPTPTPNTIPMNGASALVCQRSRRKNQETPQSGRSVVRV